MEYWGPKEWGGEEGKSVHEGPPRPPLQVSSPPKDGSDLSPPAPPPIHCVPLVEGAPRRGGRGKKGRSLCPRGETSQPIEEKEQFPRFH